LNQNQNEINLVTRKCNGVKKKLKCFKCKTKSREVFLKS
jgi:hypothetical protein